MLYDVNGEKIINYMPYKDQVDTLRSRLSESDFEAICNKINELIDNAGGEIATAGWLPGNDWTGTPFFAIYDKAARGDYDLSAKFFGQCVWYAVSNRSEYWASGKYKLGEVEIRIRTYFRVYPR